MRRLIAILAGVLVVATGAFALIGAGDSSEEAPIYRIQLRNAFDLTVGGELKIAGSPAGSITKIKADGRSRTAIVHVQLDRPRLALRRSASCVSRPQSLVGEYFVSCLPGRGRKLALDALVPVARTKSTVPTDLVTNIFRVPERQRLRLILNEFGTGLAGRGDDLNDAIRQGVPALRETDRVLAVLAGQRRTLASLTTNADRVVGELARNRRDVTRFVRTAGDTAAVSAQRRDDLAASIARAPRFLAELDRTMSALDAFSRAQTPAARELGKVAQPLDRLLDDLQPFARASRPALRELGRTAAKGRSAVRAARPTARQLADATVDMPELGTNLRYVLEHLDDRSYGAERDLKAIPQLAAPGPGGDRFTGLEGLLQYVYDQGLDANQYNALGHFLSLDVAAISPCSTYQTGGSLRRSPAIEKQCSGNVYGRKSPGIHDPDPGKRPGSYEAAAPAARASAKSAAPVRQPLKSARTGQAPTGANGAKPPQGLLDYLLAP